MTTFLEIATPLAARGFRMIPVPVGAKRPIWNDWPNLSSNTPEGLAALQARADGDRRSQEWNAGCVAHLDNLCMLDCDRLDLVDQIERETGHKLPMTFTVKSGGRGCPHFYFSPTERSRRMKNTSTGDFDFWTFSHHCVAPGSTHSSGRKYEIIVDAPLAPVPDWLCDWMEAQERNFANGATGAVDASGLSRLKNAFLQDLEPEAMFGLKDLSIAGGQHPTILHLAGLLHDGERDSDDIVDILSRVWEEYCVGRKVDTEEIQRLVDHTLKGNPCNLWATNTDRGYWLGLNTTDQTVPCKARWFLHEADYLAALEEGKKEERIVAKVVEDMDEIEEAVLPPYPHVWNGTLYHEFAELARKGNNIPYEFLLESIKTVTGAVMGKAITVQGEYGRIKGALPRFYTVMITDGQGGKGTSIDYALEVFKRRDEGMVIDPVSSLWDASIDPSTNGWIKCGACHANFSSIQGLGKFGEMGQRRLLQTYGEMSQLMNAVANEVAGEGLLAVVRDLYDGPDYHVGAVAKRQAFSGQMEHTLLVGTTPELWGRMFAKKQVEGSGLFQRFNLISAGEVKRVTLYEPDFNELRNKFDSKIRALDAQPMTLHVTLAAVKRLDEWYEPLTVNKDLHPDEFGRLNILAFRNALHLAWARGRREIGLEEMDAAIALSDYQLAVRLFHKPACGYNDYALMEDEVRRVVSFSKKIAFRDVQRKLRKYGKRALDFAVSNLKDAGEIVDVEVPTGTKTKRCLLWAPTMASLRQSTSDCFQQVVTDSNGLQTTVMVRNSQTENELDAILAAKN